MPPTIAVVFDPPPVNFDNQDIVATLSYYESRRLRQRRAGLGSLALTNKVDFLLSKLAATGERHVDRWKDEMSHAADECPACIPCVVSRHAQTSKNYYYELLVKR